MKIVVQRSKQASVTVEEQITGQISYGYVLLVGVTHADTMEDVTYLADKVANLRIFEDDEGKMNRSLLDVGGEVLSISQFTLYGDCRKGRRPSFVEAAKPDYAKELYEAFNNKLEELGIHVQTGIFGAHMEVELVNSGPVTILLESPTRS
ncbi:D-aminoacyl-tRNA deacylase [Bacillus horti]|uniref:D-aminoacyl-tRNA deacylase n=1 Tax=Caldalkalibacillus horti TaxID=77523 RepID=A0ABT9VTC1_9BACI|nr:D-aminoacyl-tRNA deacylase [Bacillus horti]MDQ0164236.1 D-tyrosyl-tRNA(Tyr) deacylase [Bacillus horti]